MSHYDTFIVRIWSNGGHALHGRIQHVATSQQLDFRDLNLVLKFIVERLRRTERGRDAQASADNERPEQ